jgi:hypothetical protein
MRLGDSGGTGKLQTAQSIKALGFRQNKDSIGPRASKEYIIGRVLGDLIESRDASAKVEQIKK